MDDGYYRIRHKDAQDQMGIVIRIAEGRPELLVGETSLEEYGVSYQNNQVGIDDQNVALPISRDEAKKRLEDFQNWELMRNWIASDAIGVASKLERGY